MKEVDRSFLSDRKSSVFHFAEWSQRQCFGRLCPIQLNSSIAKRLRRIAHYATLHSHHLPRYLGIRAALRQDLERVHSPLLCCLYVLIIHLQQQSAVSDSAPAAIPAGKKSSTGKLTLSKSSQGSSQELQEMFPTAWQLPVGMQ